MIDRSQQVLNVLRQELQLPVADVDTDLIEEGVLDSLVFVDLIARLEILFDTRIDLADLDVEQFRTPALIAETLSGQSTAVPSLAS